MRSYTTDQHRQPDLPNWFDRYWARGTMPVTKSPDACCTSWWFGADPSIVAVEDVARTDLLDDVLIRLFDERGDMRGLITVPPMRSIRQPEVVTSVDASELVMGSARGVAQVRAPTRSSALVVGSSVAAFVRAAVEHPAYPVVGVDAELSIGSARISGVIDDVRDGGAIAIVSAALRLDGYWDPLLAWVVARVGHRCRVRHG